MDRRKLTWLNPQYRQHQVLVQSAKWKDERFRNRRLRQIRVNAFKKFGYDTLVVWEHELKDPQLSKRIEGFVSRC